MAWDGEGDTWLAETGQVPDEKKHSYQVLLQATVAQDPSGVPVGACQATCRLIHDANR
jgi:hypothetical protein